MGFRKIFNLWEDGDAIRDTYSTTASDSPYEPLGGVTRTYYRKLREGAIIAPGASCHSPLPISLDQNHVAHEFRYPSTSGGILVALSSADLVTTDDIEAMQTYIARHVEAIYKHSHRRLGAKDSLYIITGCIKTDLWALAAYQEVEGHGSDHIRLLQLSRAAARTSDRPSSAYHWTQQPTATYPEQDDSGAEGLKNQSLFLQGFKLAFSDRYVSRMKEALSATSGNRSTPAARQDSHGQPEYGGAGSGGNGEEASSQSGGCEPSESGSTTGTRSLPTQESTTPSHDAFDGMDQSDHPLSVGQCSRHEEAMVVDGWKYSQFPTPSANRYHPSDVINQILLNHTGANAALSHDDDWRYLFCTEPSTETHDSLASASHDGYHLDLGSQSAVSNTARIEHPGVGAIDHGQNAGCTRSITVRAGVAYLRSPSTDPGDPSRRTDVDHGNKAAYQSTLQEINTRTANSYVDELYEKLLKVIPSSAITLSSGQQSRPSKDPAYHPFAMGGFADIYKGVLNPGSAIAKVVAIKVFREAHIRASGPEKQDWYTKRLRREYAVWGQLVHRNILPLEGLVIIQALPSAGLVSEYKSNGDLLNFMKKHHVDYDRLLMAQGIACGLQYLHSKNVVHGDLTPSNVLVDRDAKTGLFFPLITDFVMSILLEEEVYTTEFSGTPMIARPPEIVGLCSDEVSTNKVYLTLASDVYSFSLLLLLLITGKEAYSQEKLPIWVKCEKIADKKNPLRPVPEKYPVLDQSYEFCWPLMEVCWKPDKQDRITSQEAHDWLSARSPRAIQNAGLKTALC